MALLPQTLVDTRTHKTTRWPNFVIWTLCCIPILHICLLLSSNAWEATHIQLLRPVGTFGAAGVLFYTAWLERGRKQWAWGCHAMALCCAALFSFFKITQDATIAALPMRVLWIWIYLFSFSGTALYLQQRSWWLGSTWRIIIGGLSVGISALVLMQAILPKIVPLWPWTAQASIVTPSLAFDIGILFAFGVVGLRYKQSSRPLVPYVLLCLLCLLIADSFFLVLSWAPWGQRLQSTPMPLYTLHSILLALAAYRDVTHLPTEPRHQPITMPITEWLIWVLVPLVVMIAAFTAASTIGDAPFLLIIVLAVVGIAHEVLAMFDYRRVTSALYQARIEAEDLAAGAERNRVAGELHDNLTRYLTITNMQLQGAATLFSRNPDQARTSVQTAQQMTAKALTAVQQSVAALRNSPIDDRPLPEIIRDLADESQLADIHAEVIVLGEPQPLLMDTKVVLFRAAQEALTNIRKHADATHANLILDYSNSTCARLVIQDNGRGGDPANGGMGLAIMRERVARVGGKVRIDTTPGDGFTVEIEVPRWA